MASYFLLTTIGLCFLFSVSVSTTTTSSSTVDPDLTCSKEYEYFPDPYDCKGFYQCIGGIKQHSVCSNSLLWDVRVDGCSSTSDCSQVVNTSVSTDEPTSHKPYMCENGDLTGDTADCHSFFRCENNLWTGPTQCPQDLYWSEAKKGCIQYENSDCVSSSSSVPTTHAPYLCDNGDLTGDSADCTKYFYCENNKWTGPNQCPENLYWSNSKNGCVVYEESDCSQLSSSTSSNRDS